MTFAEKQAGCRIPGMTPEDVSDHIPPPPEGWENWPLLGLVDGHRIVAVLDGCGGLKLVSRNGYDRTPLFRSPFYDLLSCRREIVLDGEIAVPDEDGVTHIDNLHDAIGGRGRIGSPISTLPSLVTGVVGARARRRHPFSGIGTPLAAPAGRRWIMRGNHSAPNRPS